MSAALATGAVAIHPGYGFLSENDHFAALCEANDLVFIGAPAKTMQALSDKSKIKSMMRDVGLPIIPGTETLANVDEAIREAEKIGYPVMLKARSGGGGRGIRMVTSPEELEQVFATAEAESRAAFGDGALYLEKCVYPARHVEFQILADEYGNVVCLGEARLFCAAAPSEAHRRSAVAQLSPRKCATPSSKTSALLSKPSATSDSARWNFCSTRADISGSWK